MKQQTFFKEILTIPKLARLLEEDLPKNWRHIFTLVNEFFWNPGKRKDILAEPQTKNLTIRAICASLAEWLAYKAGIKPPKWAEETPPAERPVFFAPPSAKATRIRAIFFSPASFKKRYIYLASICDYDPSKTVKRLKDL